MNDDKTTNKEGGRMIRGYQIRARRVGNQTVYYINDGDLDEGPGKMHNGYYSIYQQAERNLTLVCGGAACEPGDVAE